MNIFNNVIQNAKVRVSGDKIHQTDRNNLKIQLMQVLKDFLATNDVEVGFVKEGIAVSTFNEEIGEVNFVIDIKMKDLNFDFEAEVEDFEFEQKQKLEAQKAKNEAKQAKTLIDIENRKKRANA